MIWLSNSTLGRLRDQLQQRGQRPSMVAPDPSVAPEVDADPLVPPEVGADQPAPGSAAPPAV